MEKLEITHEFCTFKRTKFQFKQGILNFGTKISPKRVFSVKNRKIALLRTSMVFTYYIKLFRTDADRHNSILMALLLLVAETIIKILIQIYYKYTTNILQIYTTISVKRFTLDVWQGSE